MVSFNKYYFFAVIVAVSIASLMVFRTFRNSEKFNIITTEVDETDQWKRHLIDSNINRDHGHSVGVGDLNGDGKPDVLIAFGERNNSQPSDSVYWYESPNDPTISNWTRHRLTDPAFLIRWSMSLTVDDVDNDGDLDVVALSHDNSNVYLSINPLNEGGNVNMPWHTVMILQSPGIHRDGERVVLVDIDNDGYKDVVFSRGRPKEVHVLFNPSGKVLGLWQDKIIGVHGGSDAHDVMTTDIDLDGDLDIIAASGDSTWVGKVYWYEQPNGIPRKGYWIRHRVSSSNANYGGLQVDDVDKDGRPDILVTEAHGTPGKVMWYRNPNPYTAKWTKFIIDKQNFPHATLSFDMDGDGTNEYWVPDASHDETGKYGSRTGGIVYYKLIESKINLWTKHRVAAPPEVGRQCSAVDMDGDGDLDVVSTADHHTKTHSIAIVWWESNIRNE